ERVGDTYFDAAANTNGVFWLATSSGLIRYAPLLWRTPRDPSGAQVGDAQTLAVAQGEQAMWLATAEGLMRMGDGVADRYAWPDEFEPLFPSVDGIYELRNGQVVINSSRCLVFTPETRKFGWLKENAEVPARVLGAFR